MDLNLRVLSFTLVLMGLASLGNSETCPEEEDLYPCTCEELGSSGSIEVTCDFKGHFMQGLEVDSLKEPLASLSGKKNVLLFVERCSQSWSDPTTLPSNLFSGIGIKSLGFLKCNIDGLTNDNQPPLQGLENNLERFELEKSFVAKNGRIVLNFGHLQKLNHLLLSDNDQITELGNDWLSEGPLPSLQSLRVERNPIEKVGDRVFANLVNIRHLYFEGDNKKKIGAFQKTELKRSMFPAAGLRELSLRSLGITTLPEDMFSNMPALRIVSLANNEISRLDKSTWEPVFGQLGHMQLENNPIICDDQMKWISSMRTYPKISGNCTNHEQSISDFITRKLLMKDTV